MDSLPTQLIHAGEPSPRIQGAVSMPIFQSANFENENVEKYSDIVYARLNNTPNHTALHAKLAAIEGAEAALVTGSGMAAISSALFAVLKAGDHLLVQKTIYGGTHALITEDLKRFGIEFDFIDPAEPSAWSASVKANTRAIYVESISNPLMEVPELQAVTEFARSKGLVSMIDNTFATPVNFKPSQLGFDLSLHSATKYLNGHSDVIAGAVIGKRELVHKVNHTATHLGGMLDPHACFLLHRGLKTLFVRVQYQNTSALKIARFLSEQSSVVKVNYP
jgi:cystathionine beta-lyase/cystathionine gamma-synthase